MLIASVSFNFERHFVTTVFKPTGNTFATPEQNRNIMAASDDLQFLEQANELLQNHQNAEKFDVSIVDRVSLLFLPKSISISSLW